MDWINLEKIALAKLKMHPEDFWKLTPRQFAILSGASQREAPTTNRRLTELMEQFPDSAMKISEGVPNDAK